MEKNCNLLILTARFGNGHISVANAIKEHVLNANNEYKIKIFDICEVLIPKKSRFIYQGYDSMVKKAPFIYNYSLYHGLPGKLYKKLRLSSEDRYLENFHNLIKENEPDAILSVFPLGTEVASIYKDVYKNNIPLFTCITDVVDTDEWLHPNNDLYFISHKCMAAKLAKKGISPEKLVVTGIPVRKKFFEKLNRRQLRNQLDFKKNDIIIMITGGGLGRLPDNLLFYRWLDTRKNVKTIIITAQNKKLNKKLKMLKLKNSRIYEYIDNIADYMNIADLTIGKGGGVTLFESIVSTLPMIVYKPELNQEIENSWFVSSQGIGVVAKNISELKNLINIMLLEEHKEKVIDNIKQLKKQVRMDIMVEKIMSTRID